MSASHAATIKRSRARVCGADQATDKGLLYACRVDAVRCSHGKRYDCDGSVCTETSPQTSE